MSKNQKETKKFPKVKVILSVVLACIFGFAAPLVETFTQNNVQTALMLAGLKNGSNVIATYTSSLPYIAQAQAEAIKQDKYAPVPNTVVVQDLKALGSVRGLMQPND